jgi:hypothetical protein
LFKDTAAIFGYMKHRTAKWHNETVKQRTKNYKKKVTVTVQNTMTLETIWQSQMRAKEHQEAMKLIQQLKWEEDK